MREFLGELRDVASREELAALWNLIDEIEPPPHRQKDLEGLLWLLEKLKGPELDSFLHVICNTAVDCSNQTVFKERFPLYTNTSHVKSLQEEEGRDIFKEKIAQLYGAVRDYIVERMMKFDTDKVTKVYGPFLDFLYEHIGDHLWIFTTNYDPVIENYCRSRGDVKLICGFKHTSNRPEGIWNPDLFFEGPRYGEKTLRLVKLHGSCDWYEESGNIYRIPAGGNIVLAGGRRPKNLLVYPADERGIFREPFYDLFRICQELCLEEVEGCVVIGYSFRDIAIRWIFEKLQRKAQLAIIHPRAEEIVESHFSSIGGKDKFKPIAAKFGEEKDKDVIEKQLTCFFNKIG